MEPLLQRDGPAQVGRAFRYVRSIKFLAAAVDHAIAWARTLGRAMAPSVKSLVNQAPAIQALAIQFGDGLGRARRVFLATPRQETALTMLENPGLTDD